MKHVKGGRPLHSQMKRLLGDYQGVFPDQVMEYADMLGARRTKPKQNQAR